MASILLALAASVAWGVSDFWGGFISRRLAIAAVLLISQVVGLALVLPLAALHAAPQLDVRTVLFAAAGSASGLVGITALYRGMSVGLVSIVAPISATGAAVPVLFGVLRGERPAAIQSLGIVLALVGIVLASRGGRRAGQRQSGAGCQAGGRRRPRGGGRARIRRLLRPAPRGQPARCPVGYGGPASDGRVRRGHCRVGDADVSARRLVAGAELAAGWCAGYGCQRAVRLRQYARPGQPGRRAGLAVPGCDGHPGAGGPSRARCRRPRASAW